MAKDVREEIIEYYVSPRKITIEHREKGCCCDNCANVGEVYIIKYNKTDFASESGYIGDKRTAKDRELWLCKECFNELKKAIALIEKGIIKENK